MNQTYVRHSAESMGAALRAYSHVGILSHVRPDADALGSSLALAELLHRLEVQATVFNVDGTPDYLAFLPGAETIRCDGAALDDCDAFVVLDCGYVARTGLAPDAFEPRPVFVIDHHDSIDETQFAASFHRPMHSSTGELIFDVGTALGVPWSQAMAVNLYVAIHTDTGGFRYSKTTPSTLHAAGTLLETGIDVEAWMNAMYERESVAVLRLKSEVIGKLAFYREQRIGVLVVRLDQRRRHGIPHDQSLMFVGDVRALEPVEVAVQMDETVAGAVRISFRSKTHIDVAAVARRFGGGGHARAAGCELPGPVDAVAERVVAALNEAFDASHVDATSGENP